MAKSQRAKRIKVSAGAPLVSKIKVIAKRDGRSLSGFIRKLIIDGVARADPPRP